MASGRDDLSYGVAAVLTDRGLQTVFRAGSRRGNGPFAVAVASGRDDLSFGVAAALTDRGLQTVFRAGSRRGNGPFAVAVASGRDDLSYGVVACHTDAGFQAVLSAGGRRGDGPCVIMDVFHHFAADHVRTVADTDAGEGALRCVEGVVIGGQTGDRDLCIYGQILDLFGCGDVAVDKHAGYIACCVSDHDGLDQAVGLFVAYHYALEGDEFAFRAAVRDLGRSDLGGRDGIVLAQQLNAADLQLRLALEEVGSAGDAHLVAHLEVARYGEAADAAGGVLHIDAVEEGCVLVIAGGVGGDDAFNGVLEAGLFLCADGGNVGNGNGVDVIQQVLADLVVGVVLLGAVVADGGLDLKVGEEGRTGDNDQALARQLFGGHDHQAVSAVEAVLGDAAKAAVAVLVIIGGVGGVEAENDRRHGARHSGAGAARSIYRVDGRAAILAVQLGVQIVVGILRVVFHAAQQEGLEVVRAEVQALGLTAVPGVVLGLVVADAQGGAQSGEDLVLLCCHMILSREFLIALVVVAPAAQDYRAALAVKLGDGIDLFFAVGVIGIAESRAVAAGRRGQDQHLELGIAASGDQILAGIQLHGACGVGCGQRAEVAHAVFVVARHIFIVVRGVDTDIDQAVCIQNIQLDILGEGVFLSVLFHHHSGGDGHDLGHIRRVLEVHSQGAGGGDGVAGGVGTQNHGTVGGVGDGLDRGVSRLAVEEGGGQGQLLAGDRGRGAALQSGDAQLQALAHPDGSGDGQVAVALGYADVVVAVIGVKLHGQSAGGQLGRIVPGIDALAGVDDDFHLGDGVGSVGIVDGDADVQLFGDFHDAGAQQLVVDGVGDLQVLVLGGVHVHCADGVVDALFAEVVGEDNVAGVIGVAPLALVVILVVAGRHVPALIQGHGVVLIAGIVAACADLALAVAHLNQEDAAVDHRIPVVEIAEGAEGGAGVVELAQAVRALRLTQQRVVGLQAGVAGLVVQGAVVAGDDAGGVEGVDMAGAAGPGHLKAGDGDDIRLGGVEGRHGALVGVPEILAAFAGQAHVVERPLGVGRAGCVKVVGVVGEGHKVHIGAVGQVLHIVKRRFQTAGAVGIGGVGVELTEVQLIAGSAHGEGPGLGGFLAVRSLHGDGNGGTAFLHLGLSHIADQALIVGGDHVLAVDGHGDGGILAGVGHLGGDQGTLVLAGLAARSGRQVGEDRLVENGDHRVALDGRAEGIEGNDLDGEGLPALQKPGGNGDAVGFAVLVYRDLLRVVHHDTGDRRTINAEDGVDREGKGVILAHIGLGQRAEDDGGLVDDALGHGGVVGHGVELEGVDRIVGHVVHAVGLVAVSIVLEILAVLAVVFCGAALHGEAAVALGQGPVGVLAGLSGIEGVVAGAVGAEVAVMLVIETEIIAVLLDGEDARAVLRHGLAIGDLGAHAGDGRAVGVVILTGQHALGIDVVDNNLIAGLRQAALGRLALFLDHQIELLGKEGLVADFVVSAPVALARVPLKVVSACGVLDVEAVCGSGGEDIPVGVHVIQRGAGIACAHGELLAVGGGEGIAAVGIHAHGPDLGGAVAGQLAVGGGDGHTAVIVAAVVLGQGLHVGGVEDDDLGPVSQLTEIGDDVVFLLHMGFDLAGQSIAELERIEDAHSHRDVDLVAHGVFPRAVNLVDDGLVELNGVALSVLDLDVGRAEFAVVVVDLGDLQTGELHIGADVGGGQRTDGRGLGLQRQAGGLFIGSAGQFGKTFVVRAAAAANNGVAQGDVRGSGGEKEVDAAGLVLDEDVLAVDECDHTLDGEAGSFRTGQSFRDGVIFGFGRYIFLDALADQLVEREAVVALVQPVGACAVGGESSDFAVPLHVHIAICTGQLAAGEIVGLVGHDTV